MQNAPLQVRRLLDEGRVSVHDTTEEGEPLLSLACSAGYYELAQVDTGGAVYHRIKYYQFVVYFYQTS